MMDIGGILVLAVGLALLAKFVDNKQLQGEQIILGLVMALFIAVINQGNPQLAMSFAVLILIASVLTNGVKIFNKLNNLKLGGSSVNAIGSAGADAASAAAKAAAAAAAQQQESKSRGTN